MDLCIICIKENPITKDNPLTNEHIIPEFMGGSLVKKNVCKNCNSLMGKGFEGALANNLLYKLPRFAYDIKGKKSFLESPFVGIYDNEDIGRFRVNKNGSLTAMTDMNIEETADGFNVNMSVDKSEIKEAKPSIEKKISRYLKSQGRKVNKHKISKYVDCFLENADQKHKKVNNPEIEANISIDVNAQIMLYSKIAYELAVFHFGNSYIADPVANKLRVMLKTQIPSNNLKVQFPAENDGYKNFFDRENHWVMFIGSSCFIQLFGLPAVVCYTEEGSQFQIKEGVVYKFCYKSQSHEVISFMEHLSGLTRP